MTELTIQQQLANVLAAHDKWLDDGISGTRLDLANVNLSGAIMCNANMRRADLTNANLSEADLRNTNLNDAYLSGAKGLPLLDGQPPTYLQSPMP